MTPDPRIRASDADRDRVADLLREHHAVGRLTAEEFDERVDKALAAKTLGELDELLADLPGIDVYKLPDAALPRHRRQIPGGMSHLEAFRSGRPHPKFSAQREAAWGSWFTCSLICFLIWTIAGFGYPWPLWVAGPWGAVLLGGLISSRGHPHGGSDQPPADHHQLGGPQD